VPLDPTLPTVDWATHEENAALHERFRAECADTSSEHAFPLWILEHHYACAQTLSPGQLLDAQTLLAWILDPERRPVLH
jgi:hypothetical protein